ncbi:hypothetical protein VT06_07120 [Arsukibacterium sp. MJ3]|uniref:PepSY domain-containing protein n=1 Tax=Arsukibacterium sp. MJ3 TaxID=1632859 RepID=UPI00062745F4|nr:PepSY domain-containing protein [Arsukibacterium sp. MJ3]KKO49281.1 hypothetical protein VT06_07120 [Arsukibacterium sp. MJ3]
MLRLMRMFLLLFAMMLAPNAVALTNQQPEVSKEQATELAQQRFPGKILKVQAESSQYRVRLMQENGRVVTVLVNNRTGQVKRDNK